MDDSSQYVGTGGTVVASEDFVDRILRLSLAVVRINRIPTPGTRKNQTLQLAVSNPQPIEVVAQYAAINLE